MIKLPPRSALIVLAIAVLNLGTLPSWGFYSRGAFLAVVVAGVLSVGALWVPPSSGGSVRREMVGALLVVPLSWGLTFASLVTPTLLYNDDGSARLRLWWSCYLGCLSVCCLPLSLFWSMWATKWSWKRRLVVALIPTLTIVFGFTTRAMTLSASPDPVIDVYALLRDGADHILAGRNPYAHPIESPYGTERADRWGVGEEPDPRPAGYPPLPLLLSLPPRALGIDVRWSNVVADVLAGLALGYLAWRRRVMVWGVTAMATYLNAVRVPFIIEQAWYEPMLAALWGWGLVLADPSMGVRRAGGMLLGFGLTAKQFGLPLVWPVAVAWGRSWKFWLAGVVVGVGVMLPWFLADPALFLDVVLWKHLHRPAQYGSITLASFLHHEGNIEMPRQLGWGLALVMIGVIGFMTPRGSAASALGLGTALWAFCLLHTQGYPNYFYLTQYLWWLGFTASVPPRPEGAGSVDLAAASSLPQNR